MEFKNLGKKTLNLIHLGKKTSVLNIKKSLKPFATINVFWAKKNVIDHV